MSVVDGRSRNNLHQDERWTKKSIHYVVVAAVVVAVMALVLGSIFLGSSKEACYRSSDVQKDNVDRKVGLESHRKYYSIEYFEVVVKEFLSS